LHREWGSALEEMMISMHGTGPQNRHGTWAALVVAMILVTASCEAADDIEHGDDILDDDSEQVEEVVSVEDSTTDDSDAGDAVEEPTATPEPESTATPEPAPTETLAAESEVETEARGPPEGDVTFYHFDVGQADATLIQAPNATILIDAGDWQRDDVVPHLQSIGVETIDLFILTHPHADHIGQVPQVMETYSVGEVWMTGWQHDTQTFEHAIDAVHDSDAGYHEPRAGETETFGDLIVEVIHPVDPLADIHDNIAVRISFGDFAAVYTGDAEAQHESEMISREHELSAQVLQLGHHGSSTSTTSEFLNAVSPEVAIFSAGAGNTYGHPHGEVVERVQTAGIHLYGTDVHGTIVVNTDGETYNLDIQHEGSIAVQPPEATSAPEPEPEAGPDPPAQEAPAGCIDINSASFEELQQIHQIGPDRAQQIINLRPFASVDAMTRINGIGPARLDEIKAQGLACVP
jgi:competence protein ComEC